MTKLKVYECNQCGKRSEPKHEESVMYGWSTLPAGTKVSGSCGENWLGEPVHLCNPECLRIYISRMHNTATTGDFI